MIRTCGLTLLAFVTLVSSADSLSGQSSCGGAGRVAVSPPGSWAGNPEHAAALLDSAAMSLLVDRPSTSLHLACAGERPRFEVLGGTLRTAYRSAYPDDRNNGPVWEGRGATAVAEAGAVLRWGILSAVMAPTAVYEQNSGFPLVAGPPSRNPFANPYHQIDLPQRPGDESRTLFYPGQSVARVDTRGVSAGVSTENLRWGPARRGGLLLGTSAPGFAHAFLGTTTPVETRAGDFGIEAVWARLSDSDFVDPGTPARQMTGFVATWSPPGARELQLGLGRVYHYRTDSDQSQVRKLLGPFIEGFFKNNLDSTAINGNQLASVFARWRFPSVGFEVYGEILRDDHSASMLDLAAQPTHMGGFLAGMRKVWGRAGSLTWLDAEHMDISQTRKIQAGRPDATVYQHSGVRQGHTHEGQMLGVGTGPGSSSSYLAVSHARAGWGAGIWVERVIRDDDIYFRRFAETYSFFGHDLERTAGVRGHVSRGSLILEGTAAMSRRRNPLFRGLDVVDWTYVVEDNFSIGTTLRWSPYGQQR